MNTYYRDDRARQRNDQPSAPAQSSAITAKRLPEDYVDEAERVILGLRDRNGKLKLTTSKIRRILSLITEIYNDERLSQEGEISKESFNRLQMARVRIAYEAGRESDVMNFAEKSNILSYIKGTGRDKKEFIRFAEYMEALVAWHRFYGGRD